MTHPRGAGTHAGTHAWHSCLPRRDSSRRFSVPTRSCPEAPSTLPCSHAARPNVSTPEAACSWWHRHSCLCWLSPSAGFAAQKTCGNEQSAIFLRRKRDPVQALQDFIHEQQPQFGAHAMPARHPNHGGTHLHQAVRAAAGIRFADLGEQIQARFVMLVLTIEHRLQNRGARNVFTRPSPYSVDRVPRESDGAFRR